MGIRKRFNEIFGSKDSVEEERKRFVARVNQLIFHDIDTTQSDTFHYSNLFEFLCFELGVNAHDFRRRRAYDLLTGESYRPAAIKALTRDGFNETLQVLCALYLHIECDSDSKKGQDWLSSYIEVVLSRCSCDIGVRWKDGFFYPAGAEELDKVLIEETVTWLNEYPNERKDYWNALEYYLGKQPLPDVIKNCYSAVEGVAKKVLGNNRRLDKNKDELLAKMDLSDGWKSILATYITYAHDYRHASPERHEITKQEAEAYLYMTGLIIRLLIESK